MMGMSFAFVTGSDSQVIGVLCASAPVFRGDVQRRSCRGSDLLLNRFACTQ